MVRTLAALSLVAFVSACGSPRPAETPQSADATPAAAPPAATASSAPATEPPLVAGHTTTATGALPANHPPIGGGAPGAAIGAGVPSDAGQGEAGLAWTAPAGWISEKPSNSMRRAQYRVSGPDGDGECVVFYLGPGQHGDAKANAERWAEQFEPEGGQDALAAMKTRTVELGGAKVLFVETAGTYMSGGMTGDPVVPKKGWALAGAVVPGPDADWYFKFTGPAKTVAAARPAFEAMIASVRRAG